MKKITVKVSDDDFQSFTGDAIGFSTNGNEASIHTTAEDATGFGTRRIIGHFTTHVWVREIQAVTETRDEKKKFIKAIADEKPEIIDKFTQQEINGRDPNERPDFGILTAKGGTDSTTFNESDTIELSTGIFPIEIPADAEDDAERLSPEEKEKTFKELKHRYKSVSVKTKE